MDVKTKKFELRSPFLRLTIEYDIDDPLINVDAFSENGWAAVVKAVTRSTGIMDEEVDDAEVQDEKAEKEENVEVRKELSIDTPPAAKKGNGKGGKK